MLDKLISLRSDVRTYLNLFIENREKLDKSRSEMKRARHMIQLKKELDNAIGLLEIKLKEKSPTTDTPKDSNIDVTKTPNNKPQLEEKPTEVHDMGGMGEKNSDNALPDKKPTDEHSSMGMGEENSDSNNGKEEQSSSDHEESKSDSKEKNTEVSPAPLPTKTIAHSVGNKGKNTKEDTLVVQELLNKNGAKLTLDGDCGRATIAAIEAFQKNKMGFAKADARVDPRGKTFEALLKGSLPKEEPAPINKSISASVGNKGKNTKEDTLVVQELLNKNGAKLTVDGDCGKATIAAIQTFQKSNMSLSSPNALVEPNDITWDALNGKIIVESTTLEVNTSSETSDSSVPTTDSSVETNASNVETTDSTETEGSYKYYFHKDWESSNYVLGDGRTAKALNATAAKLLRNILAGAGIKSATVTSTLRSYSDQAYIVLTQVTKEEALKWYSWISKNKDVFYKYADQYAAGGDKEKIYAEYGEWIKKNVGLAASNHLSGIAIDIAGCDLTKFNAFASTVGSDKGVKKVFPEKGRTHIEFTFKVT